MATLTYSPDFRSKIRKTLRLLRDDLAGSGIALQDSDLSQEYLNIHNIERHTDLSWRPVEHSDSSSSFAKPLDSDLIDTAFKDAFTDEEEEREWPRRDLSGRFRFAHQMAYALLGYANSIYYNLATPPWELMERNKPFYSSYYNDSCEQWRTIEFFQAADEQRPYLATLMSDGALANPELRRSELFTAVDLILSSMKLDRRHEHATNPVFVYSISDCSLRILQVHYDLLRQKLVARTTSYVDLTEQRDEIIKPCVQWMLSTPTGETKFQAMNDRSKIPSNKVKSPGLRSARNSPIGKINLEKGRSSRNQQVIKLSEALR